MYRKYYKQTLRITTGIHLFVHFQAVLCPAAMTALHGLNNRENELKYAEDIISLIVPAIVITTPLGFLLTHYIGPKLIGENIGVNQNG